MFDSIAPLFCKELLSALHMKYNIIMENTIVTHLNTIVIHKTK